MCGLGSPHWEVRNSSSMCMSALSVRVLGFKNQQTVSSLTSIGFFQRYPSLHAAFLQHLETAAAEIDRGCPEPLPGLLPILALLSRLR